MDTASIQIVTEPFATTNDIKIAIYYASDPLAEVAFLQYPAPHPERTWPFAGLDRVMCLWRIFEMSGSTVLALLQGPVAFLPSNSSFEVKAAKLIKAGTTEIPGDEPNVWPSGPGANSVVVPDWIGWDIESFERIGQGSMKYDDNTAIDISWSALTGTLALLNTDDVFQPDEWFLAHFKPKIIQASVSSSSGAAFSDVLLVTADTTLTTDDIGKKVIIEPAGNYLEITLPDLTSTVKNKLTYFEMSASAAKCATIKTQSGEVIQWLSGNLDNVKICPSETIEIYKRAIDDVTFEWRVNNSDGNFKTAGELINDENINNIVNKLLMDGTAVHYQQYARLYDYVLSLPSAQVVAYSAWATGDNKYFFSLKDSGTGLFHVPNMTNVFDRVTDGLRTPGNFQRCSIEKHKHADAFGESHDAQFGSAGLSIKNRFGSNASDFDNDIFYTNDGTEIAGAANEMNAAGVFDDETKPYNRATLKYIRS